MQDPTILLLNGPGGAGKSTVSRLVAKQLSKCALIDADVLRNMVISGFVDPFLQEGMEQYVLGMNNAAMLARSFYDAGFSTVIDGGVTRKEYLDIYYDKLSDTRLVSIVLLPSKKSLIERDALRTGTSKLGKDKITWLYEERFTKWAREEGRWEVIDNTHLGPEETASVVLKKLRG